MILHMLIIDLSNHFMQLVLYKTKIPFSKLKGIFGSQKLKTMACF